MSGRPLAAVARPLLLLPLVLFTMTALAPSASAHPLGNFTVNSFSGLRVEPQAVNVDLVVDSAEIPTVQQFPQADSPGGVTAEQAADYAARECNALRPGLRLTLDGTREELTVRSSDLQFLPGQAGLSIMRLSCELRTIGTVDTVGKDLEYVDENSLDRLGWREITATGDGVALVDSDAAARSISGRLTEYPQDLLTSPLDQRSASMRVAPGDGTVSGAATPSAPAAGGTPVDGLTTAFTGLVASQDLGVGFALLALLISVGLGALHAFAPGHGKTLMAAYMLGQQRSSLRQVAVIGLTVTITHTAGVLVLGVLLSAVAITAPALIYGWLGLASGLLVLAIGVALLRQARRRRADATAAVRVRDLVGVATGHDHDHGHDQDHDHDHGHDQDHDHGHDHGTGQTHSHGWAGTHTHPPPATSARGLIAVGFAGGMVPSPSALVVLIAGIALGRAWFGVLLVLAYGVGMALALTGTGVALAHARDRIERWSNRRREINQDSWTLRALRALPIATAALVMLVGIGIAVRSAVALQL